MTGLIKVGMADYKVGKAPDVLISYGLGSCIGISLYDTVTKVGGLLHIMLPDSKEARNTDNIAKFADTGIPALINDCVRRGANKHRMVAKIAGGAQMFKLQNASDLMKVGERNAAAAKEILKQNGIRIVGEDTGKDYGRTVQIDLATGEYTVKTINKGVKTI